MRIFFGKNNIDKNEEISHILYYKYFLKTYSNKFYSFLIFSFLIFSFFGNVFSGVNIAFAETSREQLQQELNQLEAEIKAQQEIIKTKQGEGKSLQRDISILSAKITQKEAEIKARDRNIINLSYDIKEKEQNISTLSEKMEKEKILIANTLRKMNTDKENNFAITLLSENTFSDSVDNLNNLSNLKASLKNSVQNIKTTKSVVEEAKNFVENKKETEETLKSQTLVAKNEIAENKQEKNQILKVTKGQENLYKNLVAENQKKAAEIRNKLFSFHDGTTVNFGDLYKYAKNASAATGVRTEFILSILEQESSFGANVGQCYMIDDTGNLQHIKKGTAQGTMKPDSLSPFKTITTSLGRDTYKTRVSCALSYGYGGAMGMSQFMPATWMGFESKIRAATGAAYADPWNAYHAITGTAFLLKSNGVVSGDYASERNAACKYYSGRSCSASANAANYGNQVMNRVSGIQNKISILSGN